MSKLTIRIDNHDQHYTVSEMRKRLAQVLSKLQGDQDVTFTFVANLENYKPASKWDRTKTYGGNLHENLIQSIHLGELARPEND
jgi:hypothetical protein